jgi:hypothetical protein
VIFFTHEKNYKFTTFSGFFSCFEVVPNKQPDFEECYKNRKGKKHILLDTRGNPQKEIGQKVVQAVTISPSSLNRTFCTQYARLFKLAVV